MKNSEIKNLIDAFINNTTALLYEKNLTAFYADYDLDSVENLNKKQIIKNSAYLITLFKDVDFNAIQVIKNDENRKADLLRTNPTLLNAFKDHDTAPINILSEFLDVLFIYKYCFENKRFYHIITFYFELLKNKFDRDKTKEPLKINYFSDFYFKGLEKDYLNNFILLLAPSQLNAYIDLLYDIKHYRETGEDIEHINNKTYFFNTRTDLKAYTEEFYNLIAYFIDFENKKPTAICFDTDKKETETEPEEKEPTALQIPYEKDFNTHIKKAFSHITTDYKIADTTKENEEKSERKLYKHIKANEEKDLKKEAEKNIKAQDYKKIILQFKKDHPDIDYTDAQILEIKIKGYSENTIFDLFTAEELEKQGIHYESETDKEKKYFLQATEKNTTNIINIEDKKLYLEHGQSVIDTIRFIENLVFNFIMAFGVEALMPETKFIINPIDYNEYLNKHNNIKYTKDVLENNLTILTRKTYKYSNTENESILKMSEKDINKFKNETDKKNVYEITQKKELETHFIENYYKQTNESTNQDFYIITLNSTRITFYKMIYNKNRFITDNTSPKKAIKGHTSKREIADYLKSLLLFYTKVDRENRKNKDYKKLNYYTTIKFLKNKLIENELLKENKRKYKTTIYEPLKNALDYLKNSGIITYYTKAFKFYDEQVKENKRNYFNKFEAHDIAITFLNNFYGN